MTNVLQQIAPEELLAGQQRIFEMVVRAEPVQETLSAIASFAESCIPGLRASISIWSDREGCLRRGGSAQLPDGFAALFDGLVPGPARGSCGVCALRRERVISRDVQRDPLWAEFLDLCAEHEIRAAWSSPLISPRDGSLLGVLGMYYPHVGEPTQMDLDLADSFAQLAMLALLRYREDEIIRFHAFHDALTGLGNRFLLESIAPTWLLESPAALGAGCVVFVDLDSFKSYNEALGHVAGDRLLRALASALGGVLQPGEHAVRIGGDEFLLLLDSDLVATQARVERLRDQLRQGVDFDGDRLTVRFSAGIVGTRLETHMDDLLLFANEAARRARRLGGDRSCLIQESDIEALRRRREVVQVLGDVVASQRIVPYLQPIVSLTSGDVVAFEMLLRVTDERLAHVSVQDCIQIAEDNGQIHSMGLQMLRAAGRLQELWGESLRHRKLNINVSVRQLDRPDFLGLVQELVDSGTIDPRGICLEVTESIALSLETHQGESLTALKRLGFRLSLDDFGTGHASLASLRSELFDVVKVDRTFVSDVAWASVDRTLCEVMHSMCRARGIEILAEGVESAEQAEALQALGYDYAQGYHFARPMPAEEAFSWLLER
ncbi:MAG: putative bifunctional diguanylate cyclase/phosphodiesterase [Planctomycetota bacterium]